MVGSYKSVSRQFLGLKKKLNSPEAMQEKKNYIESTIPKFIHQGIKLLICSRNAVCGVLSSTGFRGQREKAVITEQV